MKPLLKLLCLSLAVLLSPGAAAQGYPSKPIRVIVPSGAGGTADVMARLIGDRMAQGLGQPWTIENRTGASGLIGIEQLAKSAPDGHTVLVFSNTFIMIPALFPKASVDIFRDAAPVGLIASTANVLVVHADRGVKNLAEFIALARRTPAGLDFGSPAVGSAAQLTVEMFKQVTGVPMTHVPFKGPLQAVTETLSGRVPVVIAGVPNVLAHVRSGKLVALAIADTRRSELLPEVPTFTEAGVKGIDLSVWFGVYTTGGTPPAIVERLNRELNAAIRAPEVTAKFAQMGFSALGGTPQRFDELMRREAPIYAKLIESVGVKAE